MVPMNAASQPGRASCFAETPIESRVTSAPARLVPPAAASKVQAKNGVGLAIIISVSSVAIPTAVAAKVRAELAIAKSTDLFCNPILKSFNCWAHTALLISLSFVLNVTGGGVGGVVGGVVVLEPAATAGAVAMANIEPARTARLMTAGFAQLRWRCSRPCSAPWRRFWLWLDVGIACLSCKLLTRWA